MPSIREFNVVQPPTGGEVRDDAIDALKASGVLRLVIKGQEEVPPPQPQSIEVRIAHTMHPQEGDMRIAGEEIVTGNSVIISVGQDRALPATASIVAL